MSPWLSERFLSSQSDERLAALACAGSDRAFAAIVQRYRRPLLSFARRLAPAGEAEDLVQQTFMSALAAMRSGVEVHHLRGWLHQILRHAALHAAPSAGAEHADGAAPSAEQAAELRMLAEAALLALAELPARQHEALLATAVHGQSRAEVAQLLGLTEGAVRQLVHRARRAMRAAVTAITPYPLAQALAGSPSGAAVTDVVAGAGAGSAAVLKIGALVASGLAVTGFATSGFHSGSHSTHRSHRRASVAAAVGLTPPNHDGLGTRLAEAPSSGRLGAAIDHRGPGGRQAQRDGADSAGPGTDDGSRSGGDGSPDGPSPSSGSSDGGGMDSGSSGGPSGTTATTATTTTLSDGGPGPSDGDGSGSTDGGATTTTTTVTTTTSGTDGGSSGSDMTTTTSSGN